MWSGYDTRLHLEVRLQFWKTEDCRVILMFPLLSVPLWPSVVALLKTSLYELNKYVLKLFTRHQYLTLYHSDNFILHFFLCVIISFGSFFLSFFPSFIFLSRFFISFFLSFFLRFSCFNILLLSFFFSWIRAYFFSIIIYSAAEEAPTF